MDECKEETNREFYYKAITCLENEEFVEFYKFIVIPANNNYKGSIELFYKYFDDSYNYFYKLKNYFDESYLDNLYAIYIMHINNDTLFKNNYEKIIKTYKIAIDKGESCAMNNLGHMYHKGEGIKQNYDKAIRLYMMAINNYDALSDLSYLYYENNEYLKSLIENYVKKDKQIKEQQKIIEELQLRPI